MQSKLNDLTGQTFGNITVLSLSHTTDKGAVWDSRCDSCGKVNKRYSWAIRAGGGCQSCTHKQHDWRWCKTHREVLSMWDRHKAMMKRCYDPTHRQYKHYGARGIVVHEPWHDFWTWFAELPEKNGPTIDRTDNDKGYFPGNIRWATYREQIMNRRPQGSCTEVNC